MQPYALRALKTFCQLWIGISFASNSCLGRHQTHFLSCCSHAMNLCPFSDHFTEIQAKDRLLQSRRQVQHVLVTSEHLYEVAGKMSLASNDWCLLCQDMPHTAKVICCLTSKGYAFASARHTLEHLFSA